MKITIVCAGKLKEKYLHDGIIEYEKRLRSYADVSIIEINEERMKERPSAAEREETLRREGKRLRAKAYTSEELSAKIDRIGLEGQSHIVFLIGGPFGLSEEVRRAADLRLSFSRFTFPHQLIRLFLMEQIYRSFKISRGEPYHL